MSYPEAHEMVLEGLIPKDGPEFSDNPPKPLSYEDQKKVLDILERGKSVGTSSWSARRNKKRIKT